MKKIVTLVFTFLLVTATSNFVNAEITDAGKVKKEVYATSEDILIKMLEPELNKIITERYGEEKVWQPGKVAKVALIADHTKKDSDIWFKMEIPVGVYDDTKDKEFVDEIAIRIDIPNMFTAGRFKERKSDMKVTLLKYEQVR